MPEYKRARPSKSERNTESQSDTDEAVATKQGEAATRAEVLKDELDTLLDEIDKTLEVNAEEFVRNYVQKGGE